MGMLNSFKRSFILLSLFCFCMISCSVSRLGWKDLESKEPSISSTTFVKEGGANKSVYYFLPERKSAEKVPAIIFYHGGAWTGGTASTFFAHAAYYAQHGMASFSVDYRLLNSEAKDITQCTSDAQKALAFICEQADEMGIDTTRLILCGESAGGHLAASAYLNHSSPQNIKALLLLNPVLDLNTAVFLPYMDVSLVGKSSRKLSFDSLSLLHSAKARRLSPVQYASNFNVPLLIINGDADKITPMETAQQFFDQHPGKNGLSQMVVLKETGHAFSIPHYKSAEAVVVKTVSIMDGFLRKLHLFKGKTTISDQQYTDWLPSKRSK